MKRRSQEQEETETDEQLERSALRRERRKRRQEKIEWWSNKLHAALWIGLATLAFVLSDFGNTVARSEDILRVWLYVGFAIFVGVALAVVYMSFRQYRAQQLRGAAEVSAKLHDETDANAAVERTRLELSHPILLPFTTIGTIVAFLLMSIGLWPAYRIFSPILLVTFWFGLIMTLHFIPYS